MKLAKFETHILGSMLVLPAFELLKRQPDPPHVAHVIVRKVIPNEYGTPVEYTVRRSRNGCYWWISASINGMRHSNTLGTKNEAKAEGWIKAVESSLVRVGESSV